MNSQNKRLPEANRDKVKVAEERRASFIANIPKALLDQEDQLPRAISRLNGSLRSKLHRIYLVADELSKTRMQFVSCKIGCSACCHMNVSVTSVEAERLGAAIGLKPVDIPQTIHHPIGAFSGKACPFLNPVGSCSIYADRPLACRKHASFFEDDAACQTDVMDEVLVPMISFSGLDESLLIVSAKRGEVVMADIRDFFPSEEA